MVLVNDAAKPAAARIRVGTGDRRVTLKPLGVAIERIAG